MKGTVPSLGQEGALSVKTRGGGEEAHPASAGSVDAKWAPWFSAENWDTPALA